MGEGGREGFRLQDCTIRVDGREEDGRWSNLVVVDSILTTLLPR